MHQLSDPIAQAIPAALPARGLACLPRPPLAAQVAHVAQVAQVATSKRVVTSKIMLRALEGARQERPAAVAADPAPEAPPSDLPLQLRPANRLGNLHRLQDLLTEFLHAPSTGRSAGR